MTSTTQRNYRAFQVAESSFRHERVATVPSLLSGIDKPIHTFLNSFWTVLTAPVEQKGRV